MATTITDRLSGSSSSTETAFVTDIDHIDSTIKTGSDGKVVTGTAGTSGRFASWNADGDVVDSGVDVSAAVTLTGTQTLTNKTLTTPQINDTSADHQYVLAVSELAADRTVTLPLLGSDDTFVFAAHTQTLTNKTLGATTVSGTISCADQLFDRPKLKDYGETVNAIGSIGGGTQDIDLEDGNVVTGTVDTSETTFTFSNPPADGTAGSFTLILTNGGSQTVNWPSSVDWPDATAPSLTSSGVDVLTFLTVDGGTIWYGFAAGQAMG